MTTAADVIGFLTRVTRSPICVLCVKSTKIEGHTPVLTGQFPEAASECIVCKKLLVASYRRSKR